ncbi:MAG: hypothetical protein GF411_18040 [Candidatus Lokiarchaeota archaeon]|nr:hypothetical protein [Candidatus Lokiarchaeota archaeon]
MTGIYMEKMHGNSLNCAESVVVRVNKDHPIDAFNSSSMRVASLCGGGICGSGQICGAASGAIICLGLAFGTDGTEDAKTFKERRSLGRSVGNQFLMEFVESWGTTDCRHLKAMDRGELNPAGKLRLKQEPVRDRCEDYVAWSSKKVIQLLSQIEDN